MGEFVVAWPGAPVGGEFSLVPMEWSKIIQLPTRGIRAMQNKLDQCVATDQSNIRVVLVLTTQTVVSFCPIRGEEGCFLYGVFNGFDGSRVSSFVSQCLTAELLLGQLKSTHTDSDVRRILSQAFDVVEKSYFETIGDALAEKATIISQLPEGVSFHQLSPQSQKLSERLKDLEQEVSGGATAVVALIHNNKLYIANVGTYCCSTHTHTHTHRGSSHAGAQPCTNMTTAM
nr:TGF-beta-activated kinase 1 and MAP3K7-binding protein 1-like [Oncorhynchus nerka]